MQGVIRDLHIKHVFDVRSSSQQRRPAELRPSKINALVSKAGATYHDETEGLGFRRDYQLYALTGEFTQKTDLIATLAYGDNVLVICAETDYRKCHRKIIASYLSRKGLPISHLRAGPSRIFQPTLPTTLFEHQSGPIMFTIGFTRKSMREFVGILRNARIDRVVDIRLRPVSQYSGFARKEDLEFLLEQIGIEYVHIVELAPTAELLDSYRLDNDWTKYERGFWSLLKNRKPDDLLRRLLTAGKNVAFLCTEDSPEKCHRRLVSEYAATLFPNLRIIHLTSYGTFETGGLENSRRELSDSYRPREHPIDQPRAQVR